jgi:hypothetical protein
MTIAVTQKSFYKKRPQYENPKTLADEREFQEKFEAKFPEHTLKKNPIQYRMDWSVLSREGEQVQAMIEYRSRNYTRYQIGEWGGVKISLMKMQSALQYYDLMKIPCVLFFKFKDCREGEYYRYRMTKENFSKTDISWMNMVKRNDPQDQEPVVLIPMKLLERVQL